MTVTSSLRPPTSSVRLSDERLRDRQLQSAPDVRLEAGELGPQLVDARRQSGNHVAAFGPGGHGPRQRGIDVPQRDRDARQQASIRIFDGSTDGRRGLRRRGHGREEGE